MDVIEKPEKLCTLKVIAETIGVPEFKVRRAARSGAFRTYHIGNKRSLYRLSEVVAAIEASAGGAR